jgi:hypothetical protein
MFYLYYLPIMLSMLTVMVWWLIARKLGKVVCVKHLIAVALAILCPFLNWIIVVFSLIAILEYVLSHPKLIAFLDKPIG